MVLHVPPIARRNIETLAERIKANSRFDSQAVIDNIRSVFREKWESPNQPESSFGTATEAELQTSLRFLETYARLVEKVQDFVDHPSESDIEPLKKELERVRFASHGSANP